MPDEITPEEEKEAPQAAGSAQSPRVPAQEAQQEDELSSEEQELIRQVRAEQRRQRRGGSREEGEQRKEESKKVDPGQESFSEIMWTKYLGRVLTEEEKIRAHREWPPDSQVRLKDTAIIDSLVGKITENGLEWGKQAIRRGPIGNFIRKIASDMGRPEYRFSGTVPNLAEYFDNRIEELLSSATTAEQLKSGVQEILGVLNKNLQKFRQEERGLNSPTSVQEIAVDIMKMMGEDFGYGGKYALLKNIEGKEVFQPQNFLRWVRKQMVFFTQADPDNPVDLHRQVSVWGSVRSISLQEIIDTPSFLTDANSGKWLTSLREQLIYEAWLFRASQNIDAQYRGIMGSDEKLPEMLGQIYGINAFTKAGTMDRILTLMSADDKKGWNQRTNEVDISHEQYVGRGVRKALLAYYYLSDEEMLRKIEQTGGGGAAVLFNNRRFVELYVEEKKPVAQFFSDPRQREEERIRVEKEIQQLTKRAKQIVALSDFYMEDGKNGLNEDDWRKFAKESPELLASKMKQEKALRDAKAAHEKDVREGKAKGSFDEKKWKAERYMLHLNVYNDAMKDNRVVAETREKVRLLITEQKGANLAYDEAEYAEQFAYQMTRWTGVGAKNDTLSIGFDAWTKVLDTQGYRIRQARNQRAGINGNRYSFPGFKRLGVDFLVGAKDLSYGRSILEWIQGGQGDEINLEQDIHGMSFGERTMAQFNANHIAKSFDLYDKVIETKEFNFDQFTKIDGFGRVIFDPVKANEVIDGAFKSIRYTYCTWPGTDYSKLIRDRQRDGSFKTVTVAQMLWGDQVLESLAKGERKKEEWTDGEGVKHERDRTIGEVVEKENRSTVWKEVAKYAIAAEIYSHRDFDSPFRRYTPAEVEKIYEFLKNYNFEISGGEQDFRDIKQEKPPFSEEDIEWIRKATGTEKWKMVGEEVVWGKEGGAWGFFGGIFKAAQIAISNASKT